MIKHYIEKYYPGILFADTSVKECVDRDPHNVERTGSVDGFRFFDREVTTGTTGELLGKRHNDSVAYYYGIERSIEYALEKEGENSTLYQNLLNNGYERYIESSHGQCFPLKPEDVVLP